MGLYQPTSCILITIPGLSYYSMFTELVQAILPGCLNKREGQSIIYDWKYCQSTYIPVHIYLLYISSMLNEVQVGLVDDYLQHYNKANLRDLIAATGLVILLKFDPNHRFFVPCDLEIWWMALENNRAPLLYYIKLCASFQIHRWIQIGITVRKRSIWVKIDNFLSRVTLKFDRWHRKTIEHLFYVASSFMYHFTAISEFKLELQSGNAQFWSKWMIFLAVWPWNLMDDRQKQ